MPGSSPSRIAISLIGAVIIALPLLAPRAGAETPSLPAVSIRDKVPLAPPASAPPIHWPDVPADDEGLCWAEEFQPGWARPEEFREGSEAGAEAGFINPPAPQGGISWGPVLRQSLYFLGVQHGFRLAYEPDTRRGLLRGPFFADWFGTVRHLGGWKDGDSHLTNYVGHPLAGAVAGRILIQNDPRGRHLQPSLSREYFQSRLKAFGFSALYSLQFEIGPISEASIGNARPVPAIPHPHSYIDLVITPLAGITWLVGEDLLDRHFVQYIERRTSNKYLKAFLRTMLNPSRSMANVLRFKWLWYRDDRYL
jgi:hypothetical protein